MTGEEIHPKYTLRALKFAYGQKKALIAPSV